MAMFLKERIKRTREVVPVPNRGIGKHLSKHWNISNVPLDYIFELLMTWIKGYPTDEPIHYVCLKCGKWF